MPLSAHAFLPNTAFWGQHPPQLKFTTSSQSIYQSNCSGVATIQTQNFQGVATNVSSSLTVNLAGSNLTFYSDPDCTSAVTSITVASGTNTSNFYFVAGATGSLPITASATSYKSVTQSETISTNPFVWTGNGGNANWATAGNWSGGAAPGAANVAVFDGSCVSNCSPTIAAAINVGGVRLAAGYVGTVTQNSSVNLTLGSSGWVQLAGTFVGSSGANAIDISGDWALVGGNYTSTAGTLRVNGSVFKVSGSPTFAHNGGTLQFNQGWGYHPSITPGSVTYNHVTFSGNESFYNLNGGTMTIAGNLTIANPSSANYGSISSGTLLVSGNVSAPAYGYTQSSGGLIKLAGNASGQTITGASTASFLPLTIDTGTNPVTLSGTIRIDQGNYTVVSMGTLTATGSTLAIAADGPSATVTPGSGTYGNVTIEQAWNGTIINVSGTWNVGGALSLLGQNHINGGTINAYGDIVTSTYLYGGSTTVVVAGNASGQTISGTTAGAALPHLTIAAGSNNVTLSGTVTLGGNFTYTSGNLIATGSTLVFDPGCGGVTIAPGSIVYNNVQFMTAGCSFTGDTLSGTLNVGGNLTINTDHQIQAGTLAVAGNLTMSSLQGGSASITFNGSSAQTVTQTGGTFPSGTITVNNASGISLGSDVTWNGSSQTTTVTSGSIDMAGHNLTLHALSLNGNALTKNGGVLTVGTGSSPYGGTVNP